MEMNFEQAANRILELERTALNAFAEARILVETARRERELAVMEREQLTPDYTEAEAAKLLSIAVKTLREERRRYKYPHLKHGVKITYTAEQIRNIREMRTQNKRKISEAK
jgi:hypothetical protein